MAFNLLKPLLGFRAHLPHPGFRSILQFGMIFVFPCSAGGAQRILLPAALDFVAGYFSDKCATTAVSDQLVNIGDHVSGQADVRSFGNGSRHTPTVT